MKHNIKRFMALLCMLTCIALLSGCTEQNEAVSTLDPTVESSLKQSGENMLKEYFSILSSEQAETLSAQAEKSGDTVFGSGLASWANVSDELGALVSVDSSAVIENDNGYTIEVYATYENRKLSCNMGVDKDVTAFTSFSFSPEYSTAEKLEKAGMNTLMGMGTVFAVLIFISLIISMFKHINALENKGKKSAADKAVQETAPAPVKKADMGNTNPADDLELVAVITAAIAASTGASADSLVVRSIKRASKGTWRKA